MIVSDATLIRFAGFTLDAERGVLRRDQAPETVLRPKTLELLLLLLRNTGRVVTRAEILDTIWPDVHVTDDSITQCVVELRRALGADAGLLKTIPRRGYVLEATIEAAAPPAAPPPPRPTLPEPAMPPPAAPRPWKLAGAAALAALALVVWLSRPDPPPPASAPLVPPPTAPAAAVSAPQPLAREQAIELIEAARRMNIAPGDRRANWVASRGLLSEALALDPNNPRAHAEMVFSYTNSVLNGFSLNPAADLRIAEDHAERAIAAGAELPATHAARAAVMRQQRRWAEALDSYNRGVGLDPTQHASRANAGFMLLLLGRPEEAEAPIRTALALAPPNHGFRLTWLTYLALTLAHQQRWAEAAEALRGSLEGQAFLPIPVRLAFLAAVLELSGQHEAAGIAARQAMTLNPTLGLAWLRVNPLSDQPAFAARQAALFDAMRAAGLAE